MKQLPTDDDLGSTRAKLIRLTRLYAMLSRINRTIIRTDNAEELYHAACQIAVEDSSLSFTWIGLLDAQTQRVVPVSHAGSFPDLMQLQIRVDASAEGGGPSGVAIREGRPCVINNVAADPRTLPWRAKMQEANTHSLASFPLRLENTIVGVLGIGAYDLDYFQEMEINLLAEVADDISFALMVLRRNELRLAGEAKLRYLAYYDSQTGLPGRKLFETRFAAAYTVNSRPEFGAPLQAILVVRLCRYYEVLQVLGPEAGIAIARAVGGRLEAHLPTALVARLSEAEFVFMLERQDDRAAIEKTGRLIRELIAEGIRVNEQEVFMDPSVGIALHPQHGTPAEVLKAAQIAAGDTPYDSGSACRFFVAEMDRGSRRRLDMDTALRRALLRDEFVLHYQPQLDLVNGRVVGAEALLRWQRPGHGLISPLEFIPLLEDTGLICEVGAWVIGEATRVCRRWQDAGLSPIRMAVNLSARQFRESDIRQVVRHALSEAKLEAQWLELEVTESVVLFQPEQVIRTMHELNLDGVTHAMDDFGTGYSSLSYLQRLPMARIKIDRGFVANIAANPNDAAIVRAVVGMAHSLGMSVIAEGVETETQLAYLRGLGCDEMQGYLFSRPIPEGAFAALLGEGRCIPAAPERHQI
jgi:EAL domain-containing protein (putative c-di-GMP-specific phosphodiesterase class I)/GGDEF domain-containing protein